MKTDMNSNNKVLKAIGRVPDKITLRNLMASHLRIMGEYEYVRDTMNEHPYLSNDISGNFMRLMNLYQEFALLNAHMVKEAEKIKDHHNQQVLDLVRIIESVSIGENTSFAIYSWSLNHKQRYIYGTAATVNLPPLLTDRHDALSDLIVRTFIKTEVGVVGAGASFRPSPNDYESACGKDLIEYFIHHEKGALLIELQASTPYLFAEAFRDVFKIEELKPLLTYR